MDQAFMIGIGAIMLFLAATTMLGVMLIKNQFRPRSTAVIMVAQLPLFLLIASITSLGNTLIPYLWAIVIAAHDKLSTSAARSTMLAGLHGDQCLHMQDGLDQE
jgi:hypothetical protein